MVVVTKMRFGKRGLGILSPLENDVLRVLWKRQSARVREVHKALNGRRVALTSVAVILDRLHDKKIVTRKIQTGRGGEHYIYSCTTDRRCFEESVVDKVVNKLIDNFGDVAVNYFNERFAKKKRRVGG